MTQYKRALGFLSRRDHSRQELRRKLSRHGSSAEVEEVLDQLEEKGFLNDEAFALSRALVLRSRRHWGNARITQDLRRLGIDARIIPPLLERVGNECGERESLDKAVASWIAKSGSPSTTGLLKRLYDHCIRLGYSPSLVRTNLECHFDEVGWG